MTATNINGRGLTGLKEDSLKLILFGGKGGVGKTTCASSTACYLAENLKTLLVSTDPAHSLSDSLGQKFGDEIIAMKELKNLSVLEVSADKALAKFKLQYEAEIKKIMETATNLDKEDIDAMFDLPVPGIDEVMGFNTIMDLIEEKKFDKYIVDTAPTGHALRLLSSPHLIDDYVKVMSKMRWKYRYMVTSFAGKYTHDKADDFLLNLKKTVKGIEQMLRNQQKCEFIAVTIPEDMAIMETERLVGDLNKYGMKVKQLVVNNVLESGDCPFCLARRNGQKKYLDQIKSKFSNLTMITMPLQAQEVKGIESLHNYARQLFR